jgi:uncharacterized protein
VGIVENLSKGLQWSKKAAEKGNIQGMRQCADCYHFGRGVEQSNEKAMYWYEKWLEREDDETARTSLATLRRDEKKKVMPV